MATENMLSFRTRLAIHFRDQFTCQYCHRLLHPLSENLTIDHVVPEGGDEMENLVTCCHSCNVSKAGMTAEEFRRKINGLQPKPGTDGRESLQDILAEVASRHQITPRVVVAKGNRKYLVAIRAEVAKLARKQGYSLPDIGRLLHRHHTSILYLLSKYGSLP